MSRRTIASFIALLGLTAASMTALAADNVGGNGQVIELEVNHSTSDTYLQYHGRVVILSDGRSNEYRWGGTSCSNKSLLDSQVTMLQRALESATTVTPRWQSGQGSNKCLVGFQIFAP